MNAEHERNLRRAADFCRAMQRDALAEACSRAADEIDRLRVALHTLLEFVDDPDPTCECGRCAATRKAMEAARDAEPSQPSASA